MVETRNYAMQVRVRGEFEQVKSRTIESLGTEGFGILSEIDVTATLKRKLDVDFRPYVILGACNPPLAHRALQAEATIGLLLPCNVVVFDNGDGSCTAAGIDPVVQFSKVQRPELEPVAQEVRRLMVRALERLES